MKMQKFTIQEFQSDFDNLLERVENGESFIITDNGKKVVIMPAKDYDIIVDGIEEHDDLIRIHTDHEEGC
jgi:prevent-host-death family protein